MDSGLFHNITALSAVLQLWEPKSVLLAADDGNMINIMDFMEGGRAPEDSVIHLAHNDDWSSPLDQSHRAKLVRHINEACKNAGFSMIVKEWDPSTKVGGRRRNVKVDGKIRLYCARGLPYKSDKSVDGDGDKRKKTKTSKATCNEATCPFKFNVYWFPDQQRWGLIAHGGNRMHQGHLCDKPEHVKCTTTNLVSEEDFDLANDLFECNQTPAEVDNLLNHRSGISLTPNQVKYMKQKHRKNKQQQFQSGPSTPASRFLSWLESNKHVSYILLFDKGQSEMIHARRPGRAEREREVMFHCIHRRSGNDVVAEDIGITVAASTNVEDDPEEYITRIRHSMSIPNANQVLLAAVWCTDQQRRFVTLFPEVMAADVTEQTNKEKRPLLLLGGLTSDNESFIFCQAFLPSMQQWVFHWFFNQAVPALFSPDILRRNKLMLTDGDSKEYGAFMDAAPRHFPNSRHRLCYWHLMDRGLKSTRIFQHKSSLNVTSTNYFNGMINWVKSWFHTLETMDEYADSRKRLFEWLATEEAKSILGATIIDLFTRFIVEKLDSYTMRWLNASFLHVRTLNRKTTQFLEAENSVLKTQEGGPRPNYGLDLAAASIDKQGERRWHHKDQKYARAIDQQSVQHNEINSNCKVNMFCLENMILQSDQGSKYSFVRESVNSFLVKRTDSFATTFPSPQTIQVDPNHPDFEHFFVPQYTRTRRVSIIDGTFMKCSCGLFSRCGYPCRHIYAVLNRPPITQDAIPRYHVYFAHLFNRHEALTKCYKLEFQKEVPGPPLTEGDIATIEGFPICTNIPESYRISLPGQLSLSLKCLWANNAVIKSSMTVINLPNVATTGNVRFHQEIHLSQANSKSGDGELTADDVEICNFGFEDDDGSVSGNVASRAPDESGEAGFSDIDEEGIKNCIYQRESENLKRINTQDNLFNSLMPWYRDTCKLGEGLPWMRERIALRMMYVFEISDKEVNEEMERMKRSQSIGEGTVVSSRPEASGPKRSSRKRPMHSPAKSNRKSHK